MKKFRKATGINVKVSFPEPDMIRALTACQARAARAMLSWSVRQLAAKAKISDSSIRRIEVGFGVPENVTLDLRMKLQEYFVSRGFVFEWDDVRGPGVYYRRPTRVTHNRRAGDAKPT